MSNASLQSRKICFLELEEEGRAFFSEHLDAADLFFASSSEAVPEGTEILSIFIGTRIDAAFLKANPSLKLIATRSTGIDHIDLAACRACNVAVTNVQDYGENTVAEHTFALMLALSRRLRDSDIAVRTGRYSAERLRGFDLRGKTLGVVGAGRVGLHVIRLGRAFGMKVLASDSAPHSLSSQLLEFSYVPLEELLRESHVITLHLPLLPDTHHLINQEKLNLCRDGALLINTARGGLVDTKAAVKALESGKLGGLGVDVLEDERVFHGGATPILGREIAERVHNAASAVQSLESTSRLAEFAALVAQSQLLQRQDVIITPHVAYNSHEASARVRSITLENIFNYLENRELIHLCI